MKPRRLKDGRLVVPVLISTDDNKMSVGVQILTPQDPSFPVWQKFITAPPTPPQETPEPTPEEDPTEEQPEEEVPTQKSEETTVDIVNEEKRTGVIFALYIPQDAGNKLLMAVGDAELGQYSEPVDDLHITLLYLGKIDEIADKKEALVSMMNSFAASIQPFKGTTSGYGRFNNDEGDQTNAVYASFDCIELSSIRSLLLESVRNTGVEVNLIHGFTPHITLAYVPNTVEALNLKIPTVEIEFPNIFLAWGDEHIPAVLGGNDGN